MGMTVISMFTALMLIAIIIISGGARAYFRHKFDATEHIQKIDEAVKRQHHVKDRLHNV